MFLFLKHITSFQKRNTVTVEVFRAVLIKKHFRDMMLCRLVKDKKSVIYWESRFKRKLLCDSNLRRTLNTLIKVSCVYLGPSTSCWYIVSNQTKSPSINTLCLLSIPGQTTWDLSRRMWQWYRFTPSANLSPCLNHSTSVAYSHFILLPPSTLHNVTY